MNSVRMQPISDVLYPVPISVPYHAWHSTDMKSWKLLGVAAKSHWAAAAEYKDGKFYPQKLDF